MGLSVPHTGPIEVVPSRIMAASIEPPGYRRCTLVCAYGVSATNLRHLAAIGSCVQAQGDNVPCIAGGDWQASPEMVATTGLASQVGMTIVATGHPRGTYRATRTASELDYSLVSNGRASIALAPWKELASGPTCRFGSSSNHGLPLLALCTCDARRHSPSSGWSARSGRRLTGQVSRPAPRPLPKGRPMRRTLVGRTSRTPSRNFTLHGPTLPR